jgi:hypothetical protein
VAFCFIPENAIGSHGPVLSDAEVGSEAQRNKRDIIFLAKNHTGASFILNLPYTIQYSMSTSAAQYKSVTASAGSGLPCRRRGLHFVNNPSRAFSIPIIA